MKLTKVRSFASLLVVVVRPVHRLDDVHRRGATLVVMRVPG
jgi:hypothetical protein